ncbi:MAG: dTDP-4-dehydrorhamnose reductase [Gemmatimonadota bacterium]|nr:dTDP-4-dehydrorhamnose reductase [Gemmatimonadota bacterium]
MRAVITGAGGQLARELERSAPPNIEVHSLDRATCDITKLPAIQNAVAKLRPEFVINTAAFTAVDKAESERERAFAVNEGGARNVAEVCAAVGATMVQVSTDFVFDGTHSTPYPVDAAPSPINAYGASKLAGEEAVRASGASYVILRCGWIYSAMPGNFLTKILGHLQSHRSLRVVDDQVGVPTTAAEVAQVIWWCAGPTAPLTNSVLHWASKGSASRYEFAVAIQELAREEGILDITDAIIPVKTSEFPLPARRPQYSVLDASATWTAMGRTPAHWRVSLENTIAGMARAATA